MGKDKSGTFLLAQHADPFWHYHHVHLLEHYTPRNVSMLKRHPVPGCRDTFVFRALQLKMDLLHNIPQLYPSVDLLRDPVSEHKYLYNPKLLLLCLQFDPQVSLNFYPTLLRLKWERVMTSHDRDKVHE